MAPINLPMRHICLCLSLSFGLLLPAGLAQATTLSGADRPRGVVVASMPRALSARTLDQNRDGRIDHVRVIFAGALRRAPCVAVRGYYVTRSVRVQKRAIVVTVAQHAHPDSASRPLVAVWPRPCGAGSMGKAGRTLRTTDGAPPVLLSATATNAHTIVTLWSGPAFISNTRVRSPLRLRSSSGGEVGMKAIKQSARAAIAYTVVDATQAAVVRYAPTAAAWVRDANNNRAPAGTAVVTHPTPTTSGSSTTTSPSTTTSTTTPSSPPSSTPPSLQWNVLSNPIDPSQLTSLGFGARSFWMQPWQAYLDTVPTQTLLNAVGINFNVTAREAPATAQLLAASGFRRARVEIAWNQLSYADQTQLADPASWTTILQALKSNGVRPLILLNANSGMPGPFLSWTAQITAPAPAGATTVQLDPASAAMVVPARSGLNSLSGPTTAAGLIFTSVAPDGTATLSKPLPVALAAGGYAATTLRYEPFAAPFNADGTSNAAFQTTLSGWLQYVSTVTNFVKGVLGNDHFDVEVWNELSFGSAFLSAGNYYSPLPARLSGTGSVDDQLLAATVASLRDPVNGMSDVGIGDGFANQTPFATPAAMPPGLTALDKHPYRNVDYFGPQTGALPNSQPFNALEQPEGTLTTGPGTGAWWLDTFMPTFTSFFPEYFLSAIQTETAIRDLAPITTTLYGWPHGRYAGTPGTTTQTWITEVNLDPTGADPRAGDLPNGAILAHLSAADDRHLQAKASLRYLAAWVNKGVTALDFYTAKGDPLGLIPDSFFKAVDAGTSTGPDPGGETLDDVGRFLAAFGRPQPITAPRSLTLTAIADQHNDQQFAGNGTAAYPPLYDRNVLAVFPFQTSNTSFAIPVYVITRNLAHLYRPDAPASDVTRYDLPDETFRISLSGLNAAAVAASEYDPMTNSSLPVTVTQTGAGSVDITLPASDHPRVLILNE